jgi:stage II sporulation protein D
MLHVAIESQANPRTPLWFREGLVLYLAGTPAGSGAPATGEERAMRNQYDADQSRVRALIGRHGQATVMQWLRTGSPELTRQ